jgi:hypothetical protein
LEETPDDDGHQNAQNLSDEDDELEINLYSLDLSGKKFLLNPIFLGTLC